MKNRLSDFAKRRFDLETDTTVVFVKYKNHNVGVSKVKGKWQFANAALPELNEVEQAWLDNECAKDETICDKIYEAIYAGAAKKGADWRMATEKALDGAYQYQLDKSLCVQELIDKKINDAVAGNKI